MADLERERADFKPERADKRPKRADSRPRRTDSRPERADLKSERVDLKPERAYFGLKRGDSRTDEQTKVPLCSTGLCPLWGRCPKRNCWRVGRGSSVSRQGHYVGGLGL